MSGQKKQEPLNVALTHILSTEDALPFCQTHCIQLGKNQGFQPPLCSLPLCSSFPGLRKKVPQAGWLKTTEMYCLAAMKAISLK